MRNKTHSLVDFIQTEHIDVCAITETWLKSDDSVLMGDLTPNGFKLDVHNRLDRGGGGIAVLHKSALNLRIIECGRKSSYEFMEVFIPSGSLSVRLLILYRIPYSNVHRVTFNSFLSDFSEHLESLCLLSGQLLITGDFNVHVDDERNADAMKFGILLNEMNLQQHVHGATHILGHTLDLVISRLSDDLIVSQPVIGSFISDHAAVLSHLNIKKPTLIQHEIKYRKINSINMDLFKEDVSRLLIVSSNMDIDNMVSEYNQTMSTIIDDFAPVITKRVPNRVRQPWFNSELRGMKIEKRKLERKWRHTRVQSDYYKFKVMRSRMNCYMSICKSEYYANLIGKNEGDQKQLFRIIENLLHKKKEIPYPDSCTPIKLACNFNDFFCRKIDLIRSKFSNTVVCVHSIREVEYVLADFELLSNDDVIKLISASPSKSCDLDPLPTRVLKQCVGEVVHYIKCIINLSLSNGVFPAQFKDAIVVPLLKKPGLDLSYCNYRPVSNLSFVSKLIEKAVSKQVLAHISRNSLGEKLQSAYKKHHSTETALLKVQSDILMAMDNNKVSILVLLDLSAAFDTVDIDILLERLEKCFGIAGKALDWFRSYLTGRNQCILVRGQTSPMSILKSGVPQGSVLGPLLFSLYTSPLGSIIERYGLSYHLYADDTQLYLSFQVNSCNDCEIAEVNLVDCICDLKEWMYNNKLKLNPEKTDILVIGTPFQLNKITLNSLNVDHTVIPVSSDVRNLGVIFDKHLNMANHVSLICKSSFYHLRRISQIRKCLSVKTAEIIVHALVGSRLDYCNSLLFGITGVQLSRLQRVQNAAARVVFGRRKYDHITPDLIKLHWLPVKYRIVFKILLLVFKSLCGQAPGYMSSMLKPYIPPISGLRSSSNSLLVVPRSRLTTCGDKAFAVCGPRLWNELPDNVRNGDDVNNFKTQLKTYLFQKAYTI